MAARKDYYATLEVAKGSGADEIKRAYRKLARKWHPDVNPGDTAAEERFKEISEAYHVIGDEKRRKQYDQVGPEAFAQEFDMSDFGSQFGSFFRSGFGGGAQPRGGADFGMFEEVLGGGFGQARASRPARGRDVRVPLLLSLAEIADGVERTIAYRHGGGTAKTRVRIPIGVNGGTTVKVRGKGEPSPGGGPPGDLLLEVEVQPHPHLKRDGRNLRVDLPITVYEAVLGSEVRVPTLRGTTTINLPAGTRAGQVLRVRGEGIGTPNGSAGDILARISIAAPVEVDDSLLELMRLFKAEHPYQPRDD